VSAEEDQLMDCPFCGSTVMSIESARAPDEGYQVECAMCNACGPLTESPSTAVQAWNERE
jgi:Lar family restriction alleviation protein